MYEKLIDIELDHTKRLKEEKIVYSSAGSYKKDSTEGVASFFCKHKRWNLTRDNLSCKFVQLPCGCRFYYATETEEKPCWWINPSRDIIN